MRSGSISCQAVGSAEVSNRTPAIAARARDAKKATSTHHAPARPRRRTARTAGPAPVLVATGAASDGEPPAPAGRPVTVAPVADGFDIVGIVGQADPPAGVRGQPVPDPGDGPTTVAVLMSEDPNDTDPATDEAGSGDDGLVETSAADIRTQRLAKLDRLRA